MCGVIPVDRDIRLLILNVPTQRELVHVPPIDSGSGGGAIVIKIEGGGIGCLGQSDAISARERPKIVIEGMVFHHDHDYMLDGGSRACCYLAAGKSSLQHRTRQKIEPYGS